MGGALRLVYSSRRLLLGWAAGLLLDDREHTVPGRITRINFGGVWRKRLVSQPAMYLLVRNRAGCRFATSPVMVGQEVHRVSFGGESARGGGLMPVFFLSFLSVNLSRCCWWWLGIAV